ncbi:MAG: hypothetical protein JNG86_05560 [Verrucomicrobiaceae bacterium]|nr:hypothetical protein [Verrucomicrobiaceae bacterium]
MKRFLSFLKRLLQLRVILWTLATLITLYILFVTLENWTGARALAAVKARVAKEGEILDFSLLLPKPVPDAQNFCALEPLAGITNPKNKRAESLEALNWTKKHASKMPAAPASIQSGKAADLAPWMAYLAEIGIGKAGAPPADMLAALDAAHPVLKTLSDAAPARRAAVFTPTLGEGQETLMIFELQLPHYSQVQTLARVLALRARLAIGAGSAGEALNSIRACLRLAEAASAEPMLIGLLVSASIHGTAQEAVWSLLQARIATDTQLAELQADITRLDYHAAMLHCMRGELAAVCQSVEALRPNPAAASHVLAGVESHVEPRVSFSLLAWLMPAGYWDHSEARIIEAQLGGVILPIKHGRLQLEKDGRTTIERETAARRGLSDPHGILLSLTLPACGTVIRSIEHTEALRRQSLAATAIERHRLATNTLPASLEGMSAPADPIDGNPMRYRVEVGGYTLWSIAFDREDDQGRSGDEKMAKKPSASDFSGDWVWASRAEP